MTNTQKREEIKKVIMLFANYNKIKAQIGEMAEFDDILSLQFKGILDDLGNRIQTGSLSNSVESIVLKREGRDELILVKIILDRAILIASSYARIKERKRYQTMLRQNLIDRVPREYLDMPISSSTLAKYREIAIEYARVALNWAGLINEVL